MADAKRAVEEPRSQAWREAREAGRAACADHDEGLELSIRAILSAGRFDEEYRPAPLLPFWDDALTVFRMLRAYFQGDYDAVGEESVALGAAAASYLLSTDDEIPDHVPFIGFRDDAAVLDYVINTIRDDLDRFAAWEASRAEEG